MKNTSRIMTPIAVAVVLCLVLLQNQLSTPQAVDAPAGGGSVEQGVVLNLDDAHQEDESGPAAQVDVDNNADLGNSTYQDSSDEPVGQPEDANPSSQTDTHSGVDPPSADLSTTSQRPRRATPAGNRRRATLTTCFPERALAAGAIPMSRGTASHSCPRRKRVAFGTNATSTMPVAIADPSALCIRKMAWSSIPATTTRPSSACIRSIHARDFD